jgi:hypothetical protein
MSRYQNGEASELLGLNPEQTLALRSGFEGLVAFRNPEHSGLRSHRWYLRRHKIMPCNQIVRRAGPVSLFANPVQYPASPLSLGNLSFWLHCYFIPERTLQRTKKFRSASGRSNEGPSLFGLTRA